MRQIYTSNGTPIKIDNEDYENAVTQKWFMVKGYACRRPKVGEVGTLVFLHRLLMGLHRPGVHKVTFIDGDKTNCQKSNLLLMTNTELLDKARQVMVEKYRKPGRIGKNIPRPEAPRYRGVSWDPKRGKWIARVQHNGKAIRLGRFHTPEEAAKVYDAKARELFGERTTLNFRE